MTRKDILLFIESIENLGIYNIETASQNTYKLGKAYFACSGEAF